MLFVTTVCMFRFHHKYNSLTIKHTFWQVSLFFKLQVLITISSLQLSLQLSLHNVYYLFCIVFIFFLFNNFIYHKNSFPDIEKMFFRGIPFWWHPYSKLNNYLCLMYPPPSGDFPKLLWLALLIIIIFPVAWQCFQSLSM